MITQFNEPKVSVLIVTYNHEAFISQAIESVLRQVTNFEYEIVIGEDCSTDNTRSIVRSFGECYPGRIRLLLPDHNLGAYSNFASTLASCRGEYIALLEGDDHWTDAHKLQKQVDFMDQHLEYSFCFHDVHVIDDNDIELESELFGKETRKEYILDDLLLRNFIPTNSVLFRRELLITYPEWIKKAPLGDWPLFILLAQKGKLYRIPEKMASYRFHKGGNWSQQSFYSRYKRTIDTAKLISKKLGNQIKIGLKRTIALLYLEMARYAHKENNIRFVIYIAKAFLWDMGSTLSLLKSILNKRISHLNPISHYKNDD